MEPAISRVRIRNYKSIEKCDVELQPLTVIVGRNGAGKSNFLDAIRFVVDSLQTTLDHAIRDRGGLNAVRRMSTGHPRNFSIELTANLDADRVARYGFEVAPQKDAGFIVKQERLLVENPGNSRTIAAFRIKNGGVVDCTHPLPTVSSDRLSLVTASGIAAFRAAYEALTEMGFYNLNPDAMRDVQSPDSGEILRRDGSNISSVLGRLQAQKNGRASRINEYIETIVPGIVKVERKSLGPKETLEFFQDVKGSEHPWRFFANSMSDGTLRALGAIVAVMQSAGSSRRIRLVGIEEPEAALHPSAAAALMDALREATGSTQVVVTSHGFDLLDQMDIDRDGLLVVEAREGTSHVAPVDEASRQSIRNHLYTPGELLRLDQLQPDPRELERRVQLDLFADESELP